jgi:thymidylate synthase (FAD)
MKVELVSYDEKYLEKVYYAGRSCFGLCELGDEDSPERMRKFVKKLVKLEHLTVIEHVNFTFNIQEVSRSLLAQFSRHRVMSLNVRSQHYCVEQDFRFKDLEEVTDIKLIEEYYELMEKINVFYKKLMDNGVPRFIAREVLPNSCYTNIYVTVNARGLRNFLEQRLPNNNTPEIIKLAKEMLKLVYVKTPEIYEDLYQKYIVENGKK